MAKIYLFWANFYNTNYDIDPRIPYHKHSSVLNNKAGYEGATHFTVLETAMSNPILFRHFSVLNNKEGYEGATHFTVLETVMS